MIVTIPHELENKIVALAAQKGVEPSTFIVALVEEDVEAAWNAKAVHGTNGHHKTDDDYDPNALKRATERITQRTRAEREAVRQELLQSIPPPLPIPEGKTVFDMLARIRGEETEEQVYAALERLS
ncbi:MAG: hypothetical protein HOP19_04065 [Acidobacteria bacterium]|nr:hypothetical protein [Acidobacteriota bacterium]